jgi:hypothetical protein
VAGSGKPGGEASIRVAEAIGTPDTLASSNLGMVLRAEHDLDAARSTLQEALRIGRRVGEKRNMPYTILGLACLAGDLDDWHRGAVLHGAARALLGQTGAPWEPFEAHYRQESLDQARAALGDDQFHRAYTRGMALSFDQTIDLALGRVISAT